MIIDTELKVLSSAKDAGVRYVHSSGIAVVSTNRKRTHANEPLRSTLKRCARTVREVLAKWLLCCPVVDSCCYSNLAIGPT